MEGFIRWCWYNGRGYLICVAFVAEPLLSISVQPKSLILTHADTLTVEPSSTLVTNDGVPIAMRLITDAPPLLRIVWRALSACPER